MRKDLMLPALALVGGVSGFLLRRWQWSAAYQPELGLFVSGAPSTWGLLGLIALFALLFVLLAQIKEGPEDFLSAFGHPDTRQITILTSAGILMIVAGILGIQAGFQGVQLWQAAPELYQLSEPITRMLSGILCIPAGVGVLCMGQMAYRGEQNDLACRLASCPALAGVVWLFACHLKTGIEPELMKHGFQLAAICLLTLAHYYVAGFLFDRACRQRAAVCALLGIVLGITSLADHPDRFTTVALLAFTLSALGFVWALLRASFGPPRPKRLEGRMPPAEEDTFEHDA